MFIFDVIWQIYCCLGTGMEVTNNIALDHPVAQLTIYINIKNFIHYLYLLFIDRIVRDFLALCQQFHHFPKSYSVFDIEFHLRKDFPIFSSIISNNEILPLPL